MDRLREAGIPVAVVGPAPAAKPGHKAPVYPPRPAGASLGALAPVQFLATSGSLIDLDVFERVGPFRADFLSSTASSSNGASAPGPPATDRSWRGT